MPINHTDILLNGLESRLKASSKVESS